jgi:branched-chain amino acid transport system ATP-binding protein
LWLDVTFNRRGLATSAYRRWYNEKGTSILLVEQDVTIALDLCHRAFVMDMGRIVRTGSGAELLADPIVRDAYLGVLEQ